MPADWIRSALSPTTRGPRRKSAGRSRPTRRPRLDSLEDRTAPAAFRMGSTDFDMAHAVATDSAGNVYVSGEFEGTVDFDPGAGTVNLVNANTTADAFVAKYSPAGALLWVGQLPDSSANGLAVDSSGALHVIGTFTGTVDFDFGSGTTTLTSAPFGSAFVAKYTTAGALTWARAFASTGGTGGNTGGDNIALDATGNVYVSGVLSNGTADFDPGAGTSTLTNVSGNANSYIVKLTSAGNFVWAKQFENDPTIAAGVWTMGLGVDSAQNVYVAGTFRDRVDFDPGPGTRWITEPDDGGGDGYAVKLDSAGNLVWVVPMGALGTRDDATGIAVDPAGNSYVTGFFHNTTTIHSTSGDGTLTSAGQDDVFVLKLNTAGGLVWADRAGAAGVDGGQAIAFDGADGLYVSGYYSNTVDFDPGPGAANLTYNGGFTDVFALRLRTDGTFVNAWGFGGPDYEFGNDVAVGGGAAVVAGRFRGTADFDPGPGTLNLQSAGGTDDVFVVTIPQSTGANQPPTANDQSVTTNEDTPLNGTLTATDPDGDPLTYARVAGPAHGTVTVNSNGSFTYTPAANYNGPDSFTFRANDSHGDSNTATVSITVNAVNDPPVAVNDSYSTNEDTILTVATPGVLGNDTDVEGSALTATVVAGPAHGTLTLNSNGSFSYRPRPDYNGPDSFTYKARDGALDSNTATVTITVNPVNDAPRPTPVITRVTTNEDTQVGGQLAAVDPEGDPFTFSTGSDLAPQHGTAVVNADGTWTYTPAANYYGTDTFGYRVTDNHGAAGIGAVDVTITPVNDAPSATNDTYSVNEDGTLVIGVGPAVSRLHMISDPGDFVGQGLVWDFDPSTAGFSARTNFDNGVEVTVDPPGAVERWDLNFSAPGDAPLTPAVYLNATRWPFQAATEPGLDVSGYGRGLNRLVGQFTVYDVGYGSGGAVTRFAATFVQQDDPFTGPDGPPLYGAIVFNSTFGAGRGVLTNDTDVEGELLLGATLVTSPVHGDLAFNRDGSFVYTPFPNFQGTDSFTYRTADARADSNVATVTITVNAVNDPPVAADGSAATDEDTALTGNVSATDVDGDTLAYSLVTGPSHGTLALNTNGSFTYTPAANYNGPDSFTFKANDGAVDSNTATFAINVRAVNDPPVANAASFTTDEDTALTGSVSATDVDGDGLTYAVVAGPAHGSVALNADGSFTYTPSADYNGSDAFTFRASDGTANSSPATVSITVNAVNDAPVANNGSASTDEDTALTGNVTATDVDGDALTYSLVAGPSHGTLALSASGSFTYTPAANYNGADSFTFKANDGTVDSNTATFAITVRSVNDAPVAAGDTYATDEDTALTVAAPGVLGNDTDADGDALSAVLVSGPSHGSLAINADGSLTYTPAANYNGADTFTYKARDGSADSNVATVSITVNAVNDNPVAVNDTAGTNEDTAATVAVLANDTDVDGDTLTVSAVGSPAHGAVVINADGTVTYTPAADYNGPDSFTYTVSDGHGGSATGTVGVTVRPVNDAPVAGADAAAADEDTAVTIHVLANDTDADGDVLHSALVAGPSHGTVVHNADGTFTYTPAANFNGTDTFTYRAQDAGSSSNVATVTITVNAVNDAPVAANDTYQAQAGQALDVAAPGVLGNDTDADGDAVSAVLVGGPANGTVTLNADGSFRYTPDSGFTGTDTFTYKANDGTADSNVATVSIRVAPAGNTEGSANGGGAVDGGRRRFNLSVQSKRRANGLFTLTGSLTFTDLEHKVRLTSTAIRSFHVDDTGTRAVMTGSATVNARAGYTFVVTVEDLREPGNGADTFRIQITGPGGFQYDSLDYTGLATLTEGNLQVRKKA